jgi:hypothetical protein
MYMYLPVRWDKIKEFYIKSKSKSKSKNKINTGVS